MKTIFGYFAMFLVIFGMICLSCWGVPTYKVWHQHMEGKAELAKAEYSRQIMVTESLARKMSAINLAEADTIRARGTAQANHIIGRSLTTEYLKWYYIDGLHNQQSKTTIYVPTEAMIPILEAGKKE